MATSFNQELGCRVVAMQGCEKVMTLHHLYFSVTGPLATRMGVSIEDLRVRMGEGASRARDYWLADLVIAIACGRGVAAAWSDLRAANHWRMREACAGRIAAMLEPIFLEKFWHDLARASAGEIAGDPGLSSYSGDRPISRWLSARLVATMAAHAPCSIPRLRRLDTAKPRRTLAAPAAEVREPLAT